MPKVTILIGIPCSGKSTWARKNSINILSRDDIREELYGTDYKQNSRSEQYITEIFNNRLAGLIRKKHNFVVDNTNVRRRYINQILKELPEDYKYEFKVFSVNLLTAYYRNIIRYIITGKFIPFKVINKMQKNYKELVL